jgi:iron complex transport system ATP-binding protein
MSTLEVQQLSFRHGARAVLKSIQLSLATDQLTAVLGPNGAGKSTLLGCIAGLLKPQAGTVLLDGMNIRDMPAKERARQLAFLPQLPEIAWPIDVETLVELGRTPYLGFASDAENHAAVARAMQLTATSQWAHRPITELSGGERARVLLARVFATQSRWILADEPFAGLDPAHQFEAAELLRAHAREGRGVLLTIHDLSLAARIADRIVLLNDGKIVADGAPETTLTPAALRQVYGVETEWLVATSRHKTPVIAIHGRYAG